MLYSTSGIIKKLHSGAFIALRIFRTRVKNAILKNQNEGISDDWHVENFVLNKGLRTKLQAQGRWGWSIFGRDAI